MRLRRAHPALTVAVFGIFGAVAAGAVTYAASERFASTGTIAVRTVNPSTASETAGAEDRVARLAVAAFSRDYLAGIAQRYELYAGERAQESTEDLANRVRDDISVQLVSRSVVRVSFASPDARRTQPVTSDLLSRLVTANVTTGGGSVVQVIDPPDEPKASVNSRDVAIAGLGGLSGGALIGTLIAWLPRRRSQLRS